MKYWCGHCGIETEGTKGLRLLRTLPDGEKSYVCKNKETCLRNLEAKRAQWEKEKAKP
jgi:hypothetical protein